MITNMAKLTLRDKQNGGTERKRNQWTKRQNNKIALKNRENTNWKEKREKNITSEICGTKIKRSSIMSSEF